jgi:hypothetical protein
MPQAKLSPPAIRAQKFAMATRKYESVLPGQAFAENVTLHYDLPPARFLSKIYLRVRGSFICSHAAKVVFTNTPFDMYRLIRQVRVSINNGFTPYQMSGVGLRLYNLASRINAPAADTFGLEAITNTVAPAPGAADTVNFTLELPLSINDRDTIGMLMLQNRESNVSIDIDCGSFLDIMTDADIVVSPFSIQITPIIETFSIPQDPDAVPDYSIIKIVNERVRDIATTGEHIIPLDTGLTYRKIILYWASDTDYTAKVHANVQNFVFAMNTADQPIVLSADQVAWKNKRDYAGLLPLGCYVFDFSQQGVPNLGGSRDYIDTERLTQFELKVNTDALVGTDKLYIYAEKLAKAV